MSFVVIESVTDEGDLEVSVAPDHWLLDDDGIEGNLRCCWPPTTNATRKIMARAQPLSSWRVFECKILRSGFSEFIHIIHFNWLIRLIATITFFELFN